jgi:glycosyltransferase involved in cell wall biosynthesis
LKALSGCKKIQLFQAVNTGRGLIRYAETLYKLIKVKIRHHPDYYILGFRGYELYPIVRLITFGKKLIFDHMMSPYDSLINEKKKFRQGGLVDFFIYHYEKWILHSADIVLTDTPSHQTLIVNTFAVPQDKIHAIPVGADEDLFFPRQHHPMQTDKKEFHVLFYGSFLPLHGVDVILHAASLLKKEPIYFTIIGGNRVNLNSFHATIKKLNLENVQHIAWVDQNELPRYIHNADLILGGPFGNTGQATRVITGKTFQALASGKPVIIGETDNDSYFQDKINCLIVPQGNPDSLADAIRWSYIHSDLLPEIGEKGRELYLDNFSIDCIKKRFLSKICG